MKPVRNLIIGVSLCLIGAGLFAQQALAKQFRYTWQDSVGTDGYVKLELNYLSGSIEIQAYDGSDLIIDAIKRVDAVSMDEAKLLADHIEIQAEHDGNTVKLTTKMTAIPGRERPLWKRVLGVGNDYAQGQVDYILAVPERCDVRINNSNGIISVGGIEGEVKIASSAADIRLSGIVGNVDVRNSSGLVTGDLLFGTVSIRQPVGRIDLRQIDGDVRVRATSADITIQQESGSLDISTTSGEVYVQTNLDSSRDYVLNTEAGSINLMVPATSSGRFEILSKIGDIRSDLPMAVKTSQEHQLIGEFGYGGARIQLNSVSGDVVIAQF